MVIKSETSILTKLKKRCWNPESLIGGIMMGIILTTIFGVINILSNKPITPTFLFINLVVRVILSYLCMNLFIRSTSIKILNPIINIKENNNQEFILHKLWNPLILVCCLISNGLKIVVNYTIWKIFFPYILTPGYMEFYLQVKIIIIIMSYFLIIFLIIPVSTKIVGSIFNYK